jgi:hypothetical protein
MLRHTPRKMTGGAAGALRGSLLRHPEDLGGTCAALASSGPQHHFTGINKAYQEFSCLEKAAAEPEGQAGPTKVTWRVTSEERENLVGAQSVMGLHNTKV